MMTTNRFLKQGKQLKWKFCHRNIPNWPLSGKNRTQRERIRRGMGAMLGAM